LLPHLQIFPSYNNIFIQKHRKAKNIMVEHVNYTNIKICNPMFPWPIFHMKIKFLNGLLSSTKPKTLTITISTSFYSLNFNDKIRELLTFIHKLEIRFLSNFFPIIGFTLWNMVKQNMKIARQASTSWRVDGQRFQLWFFFNKKWNFDHCQMNWKSH
jgi:hypothetical protein